MSISVILEANKLSILNLSSRNVLLLSFALMFPTHHFVLGEGTRLVGEKVWYSPQFLWDGGAPHDGTLDLLVPHDHEGIDDLTHVKVDTETAWRKKNKE